MTCRFKHRTRAEAMDCPLFRKYKAERIPPLHGPNDFRWQTTWAQDAIMGSLAHFDPWPADIEHVFAPLRAIFRDDTDAFTEDLFALRGMGLVWIDCDAGLAGLSVDGRQHIEEELAERGDSLALLRLRIQAGAPSTFSYGPLSLIERMEAR